MGEITFLEERIYWLSIIFLDFIIYWEVRKERKLSERLDEKLIERMKRRKAIVKAGTVVDVREGPSGTNG